MELNAGFEQGISIDGEERWQQLLNSTSCDDIIELNVIVLVREKANISLVQMNELWDELRAQNDEYRREHQMQQQEDDDDNNERDPLKTDWFDIIVDRVLEKDQK
jgi:hypothetical protein